MPKLDEETKHNLEILKALNYAIEKGPWDHNLFFKATGKKLSEIRDWFQNELDLAEIAETGLHPEHAKQLAQRQELVEVFLSLYNADGGNLAKWQNMLSAIGSYTINRPIYRHEDDAKAALRSSTNKQNEAYVSIFIREEDIIKPDPEHIPTDRFGNQILTLNEKAIKLENIARFMHISGEYEYENNKLQRKGSVDFI